MRPSEIDFRVTSKKHYFDLENGEIFQGRNDLNLYLKNEDVDREHVVDLSKLLRNGLPLNRVSYELNNTSEWSRERYQKFGRWLSKIVSPPDLHQKNLNREVINNARQLGIGPSLRNINRTFGSASLFYKEIGEKNAHHIGLFKDWDIEDYIDYVKKIGKDKRPTETQIKEISSKNPALPNPEYIRNRLKHIGGFGTILELAGYPFIYNWDNSDYIDWGVKFMQANDGTVPTSRMFDYFSTLKRGPSCNAVILNFNYLREYQDKVVDSYNEINLDKENDQIEKISQLRFDLKKGNIPLNLFELGDNKLIKYYLENRSNKQHVLTDQEVISLISDIESKYDTKNIIKRYAMFKVLQEVVPYASEEVHVNIVLNTLNDLNQNFIKEIRQRYDENPGKIENAALILGYFDDIWPMDQHLTLLILDEGFEEFRKMGQISENIKSQSKKLEVKV